MPAYELAFPPGAYDVKFKKGPHTYKIDIDEVGFTRTGKDGAEKIIPLCGGDEYPAVILEGHWHKGNDGDFAATEDFTAIIDSTNNKLDLGGLAAVAGNRADGWVNGYHPLPLLDGLELSFLMEHPTNDTGAVANRDAIFSFYLISGQVETNPISEPDYLLFMINVVSTGLVVYIQKEVDSVLTTLFSGSTYDDDVGRSDTADTVWLFRVVFHEADDETAYQHMHVYVKTGIDKDTAEAATENQCSSSPFDISDLQFSIAYPSLRIGTKDDTNYFQAGGNEASIYYIRPNYSNCQFTTPYLLANPETEEAEGRVEIWDSKGEASEADWQRVRREDHTFEGDPYIQNGLIRWHIDVDNVVNLYIRDTVAGEWDLIGNLRSYPSSGPAQVKKPSGVIIRKITDDEIELELLMYPDGNTDIFYTYSLTLYRGKYYSKFLPITPTSYNGLQEILDYGLVGGEHVFDRDMTGSVLNASPDDDFCLQFSPDLAYIAFCFMEDDNQVQIHTTHGMRDNSTTDKKDPIYLGVIPHLLLTNNFIEAEDADYSAGVTEEADVDASGGNCVEMDAQNENSRYAITAGTQLPEGRYVAVFRLKDSNQLADDCRMYVQNNTLGEYRNQENYYVDVTLTGAYAFYKLIFDVTAQDAEDEDEFWIYCRKQLAGANAIRNDYFNIFPIGNGESWVQDCAHNAVRKLIKPRRIVQR